MGVPNSSFDTATFGLTNVTGVSISATVQVVNIVFNPGASAYTITAPTSLGLNIGGEGILNNSGIEQNFKIDSGGEGSLGAIAFLNKATAGAGSIFVNDGLLDFLQLATAGSSRVINTGLTRFEDVSTAGNSTIIANGSRFGSSYTFGNVEFRSYSTAGSSTIIVNGSSVSGGVGGVLSFYYRSKTETATIIVNGGEGGGSGGTVFFFDLAGNLPSNAARAKVFGNGSLDISVHEPSRVTLGSLEGDGNVFLGGSALAVGQNSIDTVFSGQIQDGGYLAFTGGHFLKVGYGTLRLTGANSYTGSTDVDIGQLMVNNVLGSGTGTGPVYVYGILGGTGTVGGMVIVNEGAILQGGDSVAATGSLTLAGDVTLNSGSTIQFVLGNAIHHSSLRRSGGTWTFAPNQNFSFINLGAEPGTYSNIITGLSGNPGGIGSWAITTPGFAGHFTYHAPGNIDLVLTDVPKPASASLGNISTRLSVGTGENALIGGFIVTGTEPKNVVVRAIGPSLPFSNALADPVLELRNSVGESIVGNDSWRSEQEAAIISTGIPPDNDLEAAVVARLPANNSAYTAILRGANDGTGVGLVEIYDLNQTADSKLANISTRGLVRAGDNVLIAGTIAVGPGSQRVLVRAIGPSLPVDGNLADPTLELRDGNGSVIRANDNWRSDQEQEIIATSIPPTSDLEAAIVETLPADGAAYTAIVRGANDTTGVALVEVYALTN